MSDSGSGDYTMSSFWKNDMTEAGKRGSAARTAIYAARTHCKNGHEWTPENTMIRKSKRKGVEVERRACIQCHEDHKAASRMGPRVER